MVSGWAIMACLGSWPFSLGLGEGTLQVAVTVARVGVPSSWAASCPAQVSEKTQGGTLLAPGVQPPFHAFIS